MKQLRLVAPMLAVLALASVQAEEKMETLSVTMLAPEAGAVEESLLQEARAALDRGMKWLVAQQSPDGSWSNPDFPALTALPLWALTQGGSEASESMAKAKAYILASVNPDGTICREPKEKKKGGGLCNYNTAICMVALNALNDPDMTELIQKARHAVADSQHLGDDIYHGGMGYDAGTGRPYADLSNSYIAYEAMRMTERVEDLRKAGEKRADLDWEAATEFVQRIQNLPEHNDQKWASDDPEQRGGFAYKPDHSMAGVTTNTDGSIRLASYGSMTYAGLLSFIYANVDKDDVRVQSAFDWASKHWTLEENPGMGSEGLYYFYNVLSKGLSAFGQDVLTLKDGSQINWRKELIRKLVNLQKIDPATGGGYWVNEQNRWWEADPVLVTAYSLLSLQAALSR